LTSSLPNDRGIDTQIIEVISPPPEADNTHYPDATRFGRAASFRAGGSRSINRVVSLLPTVQPKLSSDFE